MEQMPAENDHEEASWEASSASTQPPTTTALYTPATAPSARAYSSSNSPDASEDFDSNRLMEVLGAALGYSRTAISHTAVEHAAAEQTGAEQTTTSPPEVTPPSTEPTVISTQPVLNQHQPELETSPTTNPDIVKPFGCDFCGRRFTRFSSKRRHERCSHADLDFQNQTRSENSSAANPATEKPFSCDHCSRRFQSLYSKERHERVAHPEVCPTTQPPVEERYSCDYCSKTLKGLYQKKRHERENHLAVRSSVCYICGKTYKRGDALKTHMRTIHGTELPNLGPLPQSSNSTISPYQPLQQSQMEQDQQDQ